MKIYYIDKTDLKIKSEVYNNVSNFESFFYEMDILHPLGWSKDKHLVQQILDEI